MNTKRQQNHVNGEARKVAIRNHPFTAVRFRHERDNIPRTWKGTLPDLFGPEPMIRTQKLGCPGFSFAKYRDGTIRGNDDVQAITALAFDLDHIPNDELETLKSKLQDHAFGIYTSFNHRLDGEDDNRLRLILPTSREILPGEYDRIWRKIGQWLNGWVDGQTSDIARLFFLPSCPFERKDEAYIEYHDGFLFDVDDAFVDSGTSPPDESPRPAQNGGEKDAIPQGQRNSRLTSIAGKLRSMGATEEELSIALDSKNMAFCDPPLPQKEVDQIVKSIAKYPINGNPLVSAPYSDTGNADRLIEHSGTDIRYAPSWGWLIWDGTRWKRDDANQIVEKAKEAIRATIEAARAVTDDLWRENLRTHCRKSLNKRPLEAMVDLARSDARVLVTHDKFNSDAFLLNCVNGTIDLKTGQLLPHKRDDLITRVSRIPYDPSAFSPKWEVFLDRIFDGNQRLVEFCQRAFGYALTGSIREQVFFLLYGTGANGKSKYLQALRHVLGDYAVSAAIKTFLRQHNDNIRNDLARLDGPRVVCASEPEAGQQLDESLVKQLTGEDEITARFLHKEHFDFLPRFKLHIAANHQPNIRGTNNGIWRRVHLIPFTVTIPESEQNKDLFEDLQSEAAGILNWGVKGCLEYLKKGLCPPSEVQLATEDYRNEMDVLSDFILSKCTTGPDVEVSATALFDAYLKWCDEQKQKAVSRKSFVQMLRERGLEHKRGSGGRYVWKRITLLDDIRLSSPVNSEANGTENEDSDTNKSVGKTSDDGSLHSQTSQTAESKKGI